MEKLSHDTLSDAMVRCRFSSQKMNLLFSVISPRKPFISSDLLGNITDFDLVNVTFIFLNEMSVVIDILNSLMKAMSLIIYLKE